MQFTKLTAITAYYY